MSLEITRGKTGAKRTSWNEFNARDLVFKILKQHPNIDIDDSFAYFLEEMDKPKNHKYLHGILEYFHTLAYAALVKEARKPAPQKHTEIKAKAKLVERQAIVKQKSNAVIGDMIVTQAKLMLDSVMPNGLVLSECTGGYCAALGGNLAKVGALVGADQKVGDVLSAAKLKVLCAS